MELTQSPEMRAALEVETRRPGGDVEARALIRVNMEAAGVPAEVVEARMEAAAGRDVEANMALVRSGAGSVPARRQGRRPARMSVVAW